MKVNNFDLLRHLLAFSVVWHHFIILTGMSASFFVLDVINSNVAVKAFFVISGLLIWVSANRSVTIKAYAVKRFYRLYPALFFILFIVVIVFFVVYDQSLTEILLYLSWNSILLNFMHPCVGNVFESNVMCAVNGALWTLKLEVAYYIFIGVVVFLFKPYAYKLVVVFSFISFVIETCLIFMPSSYESYAILLSNQIPFKFYYFGLGVIVYNYHNSISTLHLLVTLGIGFIGWFGFNIEFLFLPLFIVSFVYLIAFRIPVIKFSKYGDLSYGLYIFHFPLIQLFVDKGWLTGQFYFDFSIIIFILLLLSRFSWLYIESKSIDFGKKC